jgi:hypothetical protein
VWRASWIESDPKPAASIAAEPRSVIRTEGITALIVGPRALEQLEDVLGADGLELMAEERARHEARHHPPAGLSPAMLRGQIGIRDVPSLARTR